MLFLALLTVVPATSAQAAKEKGAVKLRTVLFMDYGKAYKPSKMAALMTSTVKKKYHCFGTSIQAVIRKINKDNMTYKIRKVTVSGKNAKVRVTATYYNGYNIYMDAMDDLLYWYVDHRDCSAAEAQKKLAEYLKSAYTSSRKKDFKESVTFNIPLVKSGSKWKISEMTKNMYKVTTANMEQAYQDYR